MEKILKFLCLSIPALFVLSCDGSTDESSTMAELSNDQVAQISTALVGAMNSSGANTFANPTQAPTPLSSASITEEPVGPVEADDTAMKFSCNNTTLKCTGTINNTYNCAGGGHITSNGNITIACTQTQASTVNGVIIGYTCVGDWVTSSSIILHLSDPTNNLNDCDVGNGLIVDGTVNLTLSGVNEKINASMNGTIALLKRGQTGGLKPAEDKSVTSDCRIFMYIPSGGKPTGTINNYPISSF